MTEATGEPLTLLLEIQDLSGKLRELEAGGGLTNLEREHFGVDVARGIESLRAVLADLETRLPEPVRRRYDRIAGKVDRVVVPVIAGTCYGCWVSVPAATAAAAHPNTALPSCQHCGRFLYFPR